MPIVLSTVGVGYGFNGPTPTAILVRADRPRADRPNVDECLRGGAFREAVAATGRKRLIIGGLHTEICLSFATVQALKDGYEAMYVTDAVGGRSQVAHRTGIERLAHAGAVPTYGARREHRAVPRLGVAARRHRRARSSIGTSARSQSSPTGWVSRRPRRRPRQTCSRGQPHDTKNVGIIGAGRIGQAMAQTALRAGRRVVIANSRGPESLTSVVEALGDGVSAGTVRGRCSRGHRRRRGDVAAGSAGRRGAGVGGADSDRPDQRLRSQRP